MELLTEYQIRESVVRLVRRSVREHSPTLVPTAENMIIGLELDMKAGELSPDEDGLLIGKTIIINTRIKSEERKQFTRFHEITHYLIDQDGELISILHDGTWSQSNGYEMQLEKLCNIGAAEFLMPSEEVRRIYREEGFHVGLISQVSHRFGSSRIATTIQLAQVAPHKCITAVCEYGVIPSRTEHQPRLLTGKHPFPKQQLHVVYSALSPAARYPLARYTVIPDEHPIHDALYRNTVVEKESYIPFRSGKKMPCYCEILSHIDKAYVIFHIDPPPNTNQLEFSLE